MLGPAPDIHADTSVFFRTIDRMLNEGLHALPRVILAIAVFVVFVIAASLTRWIVERVTRDRRRANVGLVLGRVAYFALVIVGFLVATTIAFPSMTPGRLIGVLGIGSVAIGFAFKDIFQNMLAGILLLWREPFRVGDEITSGSFTGKVESIETRATFIKTYDGKRIIVPNSQIYTEAVSVITAYDMVRSEYDVGIGYGDDVAAAKRILLDVLRRTEGVLEDPPPDVVVWDLAGSSVNLRARWWSKPDRPTVVLLRDRMLHQIRDELTAAGVDLPFPTQVVLFHDQTDEADGDRAKQREGWPLARGASAPRPQKIAQAIARAPELANGDAVRAVDAERSARSQRS